MAAKGPNNPTMALVYYLTQVDEQNEAYLKKHSFAAATDAMKVEKCKEARSLAATTQAFNAIVRQHSEDYANEKIPTMKELDEEADQKKFYNTFDKSWKVVKKLFGVVNAKGITADQRSCMNVILALVAKAAIEKTEDNIAAIYNAARDCDLGDATQPDAAEVLLSILPEDANATRLRAALGKLDSQTLLDMNYAANESIPVFISRIINAVAAGGAAPKKGASYPVAAAAATGAADQAARSTKRGNGAKTAIAATRSPAIAAIRSPVASGSDDGAAQSRGGAAQSRQPAAQSAAIAVTRSPASQPAAIAGSDAPGVPSDDAVLPPAGDVMTDDRGLPMSEPSAAVGGSSVASPSALRSPAQPPFVSGDFDASGMVLERDQPTAVANSEIVGQRMGESMEASRVAEQIHKSKLVAAAHLEEMKQQERALHVVDAAQRQEFEDSKRRKRGQVQEAKEKEAQAEDITSEKVKDLQTRLPSRLRDLIGDSGITHSTLKTLRTELNSGDSAVRNTAYTTLLPLVKSMEAAQGGSGAAAVAVPPAAGVATDTAILAAASAERPGTTGRPIRTTAGKAAIKLGFEPPVSTTGGRSRFAERTALFHRSRIANILQSLYSR